MYKVVNKKCSRQTRMHICEDMCAREKREREMNSEREKCEYEREMNTKECTYAEKCNYLVFNPKKKQYES